MAIRVFSYNVNGLRAALNKGLVEWLKQSQPDIVCIQETKAQNDQIDWGIFEALGYHWFHNPAEKKGYSGVATLTKIKPGKVTYGMNMPKYDVEGRMLQTDFENFSLLNTYIPSGTTGDVRQDFKMEFLADYQKYIDALRKKYPKLVVTGDFNICHKPIDINHPERHQTSSGFLPEERAWFDSFVNSGMVDTFRLFNNKPHQYSWWSYRANSRTKNLGWRIDYFLISENLRELVSGASIHPDAHHSDHCPVELELHV
jgi:exodeoxyribonuclease III